MLNTFDKKLMREIWRLKTQLFAIALVVACGAATFIMMENALLSLAEARTSFYNQYRLADVFASTKRAPLYLEERVRQIPGVQSVHARIVFAANLDVEGLPQPATGLFHSLPDHGRPVLNDLALQRGRWLEPGETDTILVGEAFANAHELRPQDTIKAIINGRLRELTIVGIVLSPEYVYSLGPGQLFPDDKRFATIWMGRRALEAATNMDGAFNSLAVGVSKQGNIAAVLKEVDRLLDPYGGTGAIGREDQVSYWFVENELSMLRGTSLIVPVVFLSISSFLLNIVLARHIQTEREQIGMLKAMGYSNRTVSIYYFKLAAVVVLIGAVIGLLLGWWAGRGLTNLYAEFYRFASFPHIFSTRVAASGILVSVGAAVLGAWGGMRNVSRLQPAEAMRPAPPAVYRRLLMERLGLAHFFHASTRMILRNLERRPLRAILSMVGVSLSAALLLSATFSVDAMDHMLNVQYGLANRQDVTLTFVEPKPKRTLETAADLPGVTMVEPFRQVPVRLVNGNKVHRGVIIGLEKDASLKRMIDDTLTPVEMPEDGMALSEAIGEKLGLRPGDMVDVEVLEGSRPTRKFLVARLVREYVGANAFMEIGALNRLMNEGAVISGVDLLSDGQSDMALYRAVKDMPQISNTLLTSVMITAVREIMAESFLQTMFFSTIFAGLIAFGVVFNVARISLSERARELASLRVLGFHRSEISTILLGELVILVLLAIPLGLVIGVGLVALVVNSIDTELFRFPIVVTDRTYGYTVLVILLTTLTTSAFIWRRLRRLDIVSVLKTRD